MTSSERLSNMNFSTTEEAAERTRDADVIVLNKVEVNGKNL